jgi:hypothetical protein
MCGSGRAGKTLVTGCLAMRVLVTSVTSHTVADSEPQPYLTRPDIPAVRLQQMNTWHASKCRSSVRLKPLHASDASSARLTGSSSSDVMVAAREK